MGVEVVHVLFEVVISQSIGSGSFFAVSAASGVADVRGLILASSHVVGLALRRNAFLLLKTINLHHVELLQEVGLAHFQQG